MGELLGVCALIVFCVLAAIGTVNSVEHFSTKWQCEADNNVNHCKRSLKYEPTYPDA